MEVWAHSQIYRFLAEYARQHFRDSYLAAVDTVNNKVIFYIPKAVYEMHKDSIHQLIDPDMIEIRLGDKLEVIDQVGRVKAE